MNMVEVTSNQVVTDVIRNLIECAFVSQIFHLMRLPGGIGGLWKRVRYRVLRRAWVAQIIDETASTPPVTYGESIQPSVSSRMRHTDI